MTEKKDIERMIHDLDTLVDAIHHGKTKEIYNQKNNYYDVFYQNNGADYDASMLLYRVSAFLKEIVKTCEMKVVLENLRVLHHVLNRIDNIKNKTGLNTASIAVVETDILKYIAEIMDDEVKKYGRIQIISSKESEEDDGK